jgi:hypothetical protein
MLLRLRLPLLLLRQLTSQAGVECDVTPTRQADVKPTKHLLCLSPQLRVLREQRLVQLLPRAAIRIYTVLASNDLRIGRELRARYACAAVLTSIVLRHEVCIEREISEPDARALFDGTNIQLLLPKFRVNYVPKFRL